MLAIISGNATDRFKAEKSDSPLEFDIKNDVSDESHGNDRLPLTKCSHQFRCALSECLLKIMESDPGSSGLVLVTSLSIGLREKEGPESGSGLNVNKSKEERKEKEEKEKLAEKERLSFERLVKVSLSSSFLPSLLLLLSPPAPSSLTITPTSSTDWNDECASLAAQFLFSSVTCVCDEKKMVVLGLVLPVISTYLTRMNAGMERGRYIVTAILTDNILVIIEL